MIDYYHSLENILNEEINNFVIIINLKKDLN